VALADLSVGLVKAKTTFHLFPRLAGTKFYRARQKKKKEEKTPPRKMGDTLRTSGTEEKLQKVTSEKFSKGE